MNDHNISLPTSLDIPVLILPGALATLTQARVEVMKRLGKGFEILPRRWVVERTKAWLVQNRRLVIDYEKLPLVE